MAREMQNRVLDLVEEAFSLPMTREDCPGWLRRPGRSEFGDLWNTVCSVYLELTSLELPEVMPARERRSLDAVIEHEWIAGDVPAEGWCELAAAFLERFEPSN
jgi:hypothetical protein